MSKDIFFQKFSPTITPKRTILNLMQILALTQISERKKEMNSFCIQSVNKSEIY